MNSKDLGQLPTEIIQEILKRLVPYSFSFRDVEYQLINRHWYLSSLEVVYKELPLDGSLDRYDNFSKLENFVQFLQNPTYNIGQYVKKIDIGTESKEIL